MSHTVFICVLIWGVGATITLFLLDMGKRSLAQSEPDVDRGGLITETMIIFLWPLSFTWITLNAVIKFFKKDN